MYVSIYNKCVLDEFAIGSPRAAGRQLGKPPAVSLCHSVSMAYRS